jgi:hypothetical protein
MCAKQLEDCELNKIKGPDGKTCADMVVEMHQALIGDYSKEGLVAEIRKNTRFRKMAQGALSVIFVALVGVWVNLLGACGGITQAN